MNQSVTWRQRALPWVVCFSAALFFAYELLQLHVMNVIAPSLMSELGLTATDFGFLSSTYLIADVIFLLPAGIILDRCSIRTVIISALAFCLLGTVGLMKSTTLLMASASHFLSGIGNAFCFLSCVLLISHWFPKHRHAFVIGLMITVGMLGGVIAQVPFSLLSNALGWRGALMVDVAIGFFILGVICYFVYDAPSCNERKKEKAIPFFRGLKQAVCNTHTVCCGLYTCMMNLPLMIISAVWGSLYLTQIHHLESVVASLIVSMICMGTIVGAPLYGWVSERGVSRKTLMIFGAFSALAVFLLIMRLSSPGAMVLGVLFFLLGLVTSSQALGYPEITTQAPKELEGTSMGVAALIIMGVPAILQPLSGKLLDWGWNGLIVNGIPVYTTENFQMAFCIFPIGFLIALTVLKAMKSASVKSSVASITSRPVLNE